jgi:ABC-2 type transport system ATP-binding protein
VIEADRLTKRFGRHTAIDGVSLRVARGEIVGFLGPNGAGKTTTLRILAGVFPPTSGRARIDGHDLARAPQAARRRLGYAPERPALRADATVADELAVVAALRDVPARARRAAVDDALARTGLVAHAGRRTGALSRGVRQRVGLALALVGDPPALLLDEPSAGLDPEQAAWLRDLVRGLGRAHAVFVSSHLLADMEALCDRVVVLQRGRVLAEGAPATLAARLRATVQVDVEAGAPGAALADALAAVAGVRAVRLVGDGGGRARCRVEVAHGADARPALAAAVAARGWPLFALTAVEPSLEEAFLALVGGTPGAAAAAGTPAPA